ncbi:hypothetical protein F2P81_012416 [Scophthalmus maximus]|uniref:TdIF1 C-terminal domain-containing protein n=1 Tax=Scophthalmus maximus TaxID=52904 RepID=A0A6A4SRA9_SCOMX|nr:hypothetical protein F2P81_012416 [Scophthalmus maximus]
MGAHRGEGDRDWLQQDGQEQLEQTPLKRTTNERKPVKNNNKQTEIDVQVIITQVNWSLYWSSWHLQYFYKQKLSSTLWFCEAKNMFSLQRHQDMSPGQTGPIETMEHDDQTQTDSQTRTTLTHGRQRKTRPSAALVSSDRPMTFSQGKPKPEPIKREGPKAYLLIEEDIQDLSRSDDYKDCPDVRMDEMKPFTVPLWMVEKMQRAMEAQRDADL